MRRSVAVVACALTLLVSTAAHGEGFNNLFAGLNGLANVLLAPDPLIGIMEPPEEFEDVPLPQVTGRVLGFGAGMVMMGYRATMAVLDIVLVPFWVFPTLSPEPRFEMISDVEYE